MSKFRKKPVVIEAVQWHGANLPEILAFADSGDRWKQSAGDCPNVGGWGIGHTPMDGVLFIPTPEGEMRANPGDWIIRGVKGELYPCKPDIFEKTYEPVET